MSRPLFTITTLMAAPTHASMANPVAMNTAAAARVEAESTASNRASAPEATRESDPTRSPVAFTWRPNTSFTTTAAAMITSDVGV